MPVFSSLKKLPAAKRIKTLVDDLFNLGYQRSWAQEGEDLILARYFECVHDGFYVDVGAHHPRRFSNTLIFYRRGWRGINIDATPGSMRRFRAARPRDINLEVAIGSCEGQSVMSEFDEPALNTLDEATAQAHESNGYTIRARHPVPVRTLAATLTAHVPPGQTIHILSVDVEGLDLQVLGSNDWARFRPVVVVVESLRTVAGRDAETDAFLDRLGYRLFAQTVNTRFYEHVSSRPA